MNDEDLVAIMATIIYTTRQDKAPKDLHPMADAIQSAERLLHLVTYYNKVGEFPAWAYEAQEGGVK